MRHLQGLIGGETAAGTRCTAGRGLSLTHLHQRHSLLLTTVIRKQVRPWCWSMLHTDEIKKRKSHTDEITRNSVETCLNHVDARGVWSWMKCVRVAPSGFSTIFSESGTWQDGCRSILGRAPRVVLHLLRSKDLEAGHRKCQGERSMNDFARVINVTVSFLSNIWFTQHVLDCRLSMTRRPVTGLPL